MDYRILGPLEVRHGAKTLKLASDKQRAVLALLLLRANQVVSADHLIDALWGERPPPTATKALQVHVSRLRRALAADGVSTADRSNGVLVTQGHGYVLRVGPGELDLDRFRALVDDGRAALAAGDPDRAAQQFAEALAMWRGPPLADFTYEAFAQEEIAQLEELHLGAAEERIEAELALGHHEQLVGELTALVGRNPLRERLRMQLMLALYRCERQAEALDVYDGYQRTLSEQLGLQPGARLQHLHAAILERDPALEPPPVAARTGSEPATPPPPPPVRGRRRRPASLIAVALIAVALAAAVLMSRGSRAQPLTAIPADSVGAITPAGSIGASVPVGSSPSSVAAGDGAVWVANYNDDTVSRIDPATHSVQTIPVDSTPSGIAVGDGGVWVANNFSGTVSWINPNVNRVVKTIGVGNGPNGVAVGDGAVWVANANDGTISRINGVTGTVVSTIPLGAGATAVAAGFGAIWVSDEAEERVLRVDVRSNQVIGSISVGAGPTAITVGYGSVWVTNSLDDTVSRIDPQANRVVATIPVGYGPDAIAAGAGGLWIADEFGGDVRRIDPATNAPDRTIQTRNRPQGVAIAGRVAWVSAQTSHTTHRGGTLTVLTSTPFDTNDPAGSGVTIAPVLTLTLTNDGLTAFKRVGGSDGAQVVPDLAVSVPAPTDGGRTYTFQLRRGIRYSNGQLVKPDDFRRAIERGFKFRAFAYQEYYESIVGGAACVAHPARCDLSHGIVADDTANTVTFHLTKPDPELLDRLACVWAVAVPSGTPTKWVKGTDNLPAPLPATGPYEIVRYSPKREVTLVRNPYFHEWSHAARPDGYPDRIVWRVGATPSAAVTAIERGRADYALDGPPPSRLAEVQTRLAGQLHPNPNDTTAALFFNTQVAPFNDVRVRQALNYAVDRHEIARLIGQASRPTCQLLPPFVFGYKRYCPYTLHPNRAGIWTAPDLARARSLIAASHTRGMRVAIWSQPSYGINYGSTGHYLVSLLNSLGYRARLTSAAADGPGTSRWRRYGQAAFQTSVPAYPAASEFIQYQFYCPFSTPWRFCSPRLDATMQRAFAAEGPLGAATPAAAALWASADRQITDQAALVPLVTPYTLDLVSRRVGNYEYNTAWGILLDQLWVR